MPTERTTSAGFLAGLVRRKRAHAQRVDFAAHARTERSVHQLMPCQRPLARKQLRDNACLEMSTIVAGDRDFGTGQTGSDQLLYVSGIQGKLRGYRAKKCVHDDTRLVARAERPTQSADPKRV